jgi:lipopolysaccharide transport system permease protein
MPAHAPADPFVARPDAGFEPPWIGPSPSVLARARAGVLAFPRLIVAHKDLIQTGVRREVRVRFHGSLFGPGWALLAPLCVLAAYALVFATFLGVRLSAEHAGEPLLLPAYMFAGALSAASVTATVARAAGVILENRGLVHKRAYPCALLPVQVALVEGFLFCAGALVLAVALAVTRGIGGTLVLAPVLIVLQVVFACGLGWLAAAANVFLRDTASLLSIALPMWTLATPVFWVRAGVPGVERFRAMIEWNPLSRLIDAWRAVLLPGVESTSSALHAVLAFAPFAFAACLLGLCTFAACEAHFPDEV